MTDTTIYSAFIGIAGSPNTGKSTLLNRLVGHKVAIVSNRPQTTRYPITGITKHKGVQLVFTDTPGIQAPRNILGRHMLKSAEGAISEADAVVVVLDATRGLGERDHSIIKKLEGQKTPTIIAVNKTDAAPRKLILETLAAAGKYDWVEAIVPISARTGEGLEKLMEILENHAQNGPQYFPDDMVTDQSQPSMVAEIIREKILMLLQEEVPHGIFVETESIKRRDSGLYDISALIICEKASHKGIIIGKQGSMIRQIGEKARMDIEKMLDSHIFLQLFVKTEEDWRNRPRLLKEMGYE
jgi:GTPase